jgi:hypothetical protein
MKLASVLNQVQITLYWYDHDIVNAFILLLPEYVDYLLVE